MWFQFRCSRCPPNSSFFVPDTWKGGVMPCPRGHLCRVPAAPASTPTTSGVAGGQPVPQRQAPAATSATLAASQPPRQAKPASGFVLGWLLTACFFGLVLCGTGGFVVVLWANPRPIIAEATKPKSRTEPARPPVPPTGKAVPALPPPVANAAPLPKPLLLRVRSLDAFFKAMNRVGEAAGVEKDVAAQEAFVRQQCRVAGQPVFDMTRPLGVYWVVDPQPQVVDPRPQVVVSPVLMVPVAQDLRFLTWLQNLGGKVQEEKGLPESYRIEEFRISVPQPQPNGGVQQVLVGLGRSVYCRFANGYAYLSQSSIAALRDVGTIDPLHLLGDDSRPLLSAHFFIDALPAELDVVGFLMKPELKEQALQNSWLKDFKGQEKQMEQAMNMYREWLRIFLKEGKELSLELDVPEHAEALNVELTFRAKEGTDLAKNLRALAGPSLFGGMLRDKPALAVLGHVQLPKVLRDLVAPKVREITELTLKDVDKGPHAAEVKQLFTTLESTIAGGELDVAAVLWQDAAGRVDSIGGLKLVQADQFEQAWKTIGRAAPPEEQKRVQFDVAREGTVNIHKVDVSAFIPWKQFQEGLPDQFALNAALLAYRPDCVLTATGPKRMELMKQAVKSKPTEAPVLHVEANLKELVPLFGKEAAREAAARAFKDRPGNCLLRIEGGEELRLRHRLDLSILRFMRIVLADPRNAPLAPNAH
jgi:hypothetical protein